MNKSLDTLTNNKSSFSINNEREDNRDFDVSYWNKREENFIKRVFPHYRNIINLLLKFNSQKDKFQKFIEGNEISVSELFFDAVDRLVLLRPNTMTVTITRNSLYFSLLFEKEIKVNYEVLFDKTEDNVEVIFTAYENKERGASYMGTMDAMIDELKIIVPAQQENQDEQIKGFGAFKDFTKEECFV
jgi:hypothetical protein